MVSTSRCLSPDSIMMIFRHVTLVQRCQTAMRWIPYSSAYCQVRVGSYCYILSYQALKTDTT